MKTLLGLMGGGAIVTVWRLIPAIVKVPAIFGAGMLAAADLNKDINESWVSGRIFGGQAAEGDAKVTDPGKTLKQYRAGLPVPGAAAAVGVEIAGKNADALQKQAYADAAAESEDEILAKLKAGLRITTTEQLRLIELQSARQDYLTKKANAEKAAIMVKLLGPSSDPAYAHDTSMRGVFERTR